MDRFTWADSTIGLSSSEDATVKLLDAQMPRGVCYVPIRMALQRAEQMDRPTLRRLALSLDHAAAFRKLSAGDLQQWQAYEERVLMLLGVEDIAALRCEIPDDARHDGVASSQ